MSNQYRLDEAKARSSGGTRGEMPTRVRAVTQKNQNVSKGNRICIKEELSFGRVADLIANISDDANDA